MTEHAAFLNAVMEWPDDDLPRLVYADYLEETGDAERAEFIRVQIELARLDADDGRFPELTRRESELLRAGVGGYIPGVRGKQYFRRGFVESLDTTAERLIASPRPILLLAPIRELRIRNADNTIGDLAKVPGLDRIESLDLRNNSFGTQDRVARFFSEAPLRSLTRLHLGNNQLWSDNVERLVASPWTAQLRSLDLSGNAIGDAGAAVLAGSESLRGLQTLILRSDGLDLRDRITENGATDIGRSRALAGLRWLDIGRHEIEEDGLYSLAASVGMPELERIDAPYNHLGIDGFSDFLQAPSREAVRIWNLSGSTVYLSAAEGFAAWPQLESLDELILERCEWSPGARERLAESAWAYKIRMGDPVSGELA